MYREPGRRCKAGESRPEGQSAMDQEHNAHIGEVPATNLSDRHHGSERFDVAALRRAHPIETVVASSGVELTRRGQGFMGCCLLVGCPTGSTVSRAMPVATSSSTSPGSLGCPSLTWREPWSQAPCSTGRRRPA